MQSLYWRSHIVVGRYCSVALCLCTGEVSIHGSWFMASLSGHRRKRQSGFRRGGAKVGGFGSPEFCHRLNHSRAPPSRGGHGSTGVAVVEEKTPPHASSTSSEPRERDRARKWIRATTTAVVMLTKASFCRPRQQTQHPVSTYILSVCNQNVGNLEFSLLLIIFARV